MSLPILEPKYLELCNSIFLLYLEKMVKQNILYYIEIISHLVSYDSDCISEYINKNDLINKFIINKYSDCPEISTGIIRFIKTMLKTKDSSFIKGLISNDKPMNYVFKLLNENFKSKNLVFSTVLDLINFIFVNCDCLIEYIYSKHLESFNIIPEYKLYIKRKYNNIYGKKEQIQEIVKRERYIYYYFIRIDEQSSMALKKIKVVTC